MSDDSAFERCLARNAESPCPVARGIRLFELGPGVVCEAAADTDRIGVATSSLTFFQQIGGTVGLTLAGTLLADKIATELPARIVQAGVPPAFLTGFSPDSAVAEAPRRQMPGYKPPT